tara:strand:+ start:3111 stop:3305 length:195 start_codon:yes stop_codon:yes gene_type:complete
MKKTINIDGGTVTIGDWVSFKYDVEQDSKVIDIRAGEILVAVEEGDYVQRRGEQVWLRSDKFSV